MTVIWYIMETRKCIQNVAHNKLENTVSQSRDWHSCSKLGSSWFKNRHANRVLWLLLWFSAVLPHKFRNSAMYKERIPSFPILSNSLFTDLSKTPRYTILVIPPPPLLLFLFFLFLFFFFLDGTTVQYGPSS